MGQRWEEARCDRCGQGDLRDCSARLFSEGQDSKVYQPETSISEGASDLDAGWLTQGPASYLRCLCGAHIPAETTMVVVVVACLY